jgi:hypothetical protein
MRRSAVQFFGCDESMAAAGAFSDELSGTQGLNMRAAYALCRALIRMRVVLTAGG